MMICLKASRQLFLRESRFLIFPPYTAVVSVGVLNFSVAIAIDLSDKFGTGMPRKRACGGLQLNAALHSLSYTNSRVTQISSGNSRICFLFSCTKATNSYFNLANPKIEIKTKRKDSKEINCFSIAHNL